MMLCGIDEAGRGPLAGPVVAAAVVLAPAFPVDRLADSKRLRPEARAEAEALIRREAVRWGIGHARHDEIDRLNIHHATLLAMQRAFAAMLYGVRDAEPAPTAPSELNVGPVDAGGTGELSPLLASGDEPAGRVLVDGRFAPELVWPAEAVIGGDATVHEIQAASILAKTARDRWMERYALHVPGYGFERHKGYPTAAHRTALNRLGPSPIHRMSFRLAPSSSS
ncbi:MAG: ribonuclease HII [Spirochaetaceae bacterium]